ncbi:MAG: TIGR03564 family F420-dependent LLM class oxidoreductase [Ktedonobacteraceae bacterium]
MSQENATLSAQRPIQERVGLAIVGATAKEIVATIVAAEEAGVRQVWMTQVTPAPDTLAIFAAAAVQTSRIRFGTSIVPTYPRHPLALALQALTLGDLAPGRLRLGVGPSHRPVIESVYGIKMDAPLEHEREYVGILRAALWEGNVDFHGKYYNVKTTFSRTPRTPILISALRTGAYQLAGEIADGAISWMSPTQFLLEKAMPALKAGGKKGERTVPPLIAHVPVALSQDRPAVLKASREQLGRYGRLPFYSSMFADAGYPLVADGVMSDALFDNLVVSGDEATIIKRLTALLAAGLDELLITSVSVVDAQEEQKQLAQLIGRL